MNEDVVQHTVCENETESRTRALTERGMELYLTQRDSLRNSFEDNWTALDTFIKTINLDEYGILVLRKTEKRLQALYDTYKKSAENFFDFLRRSRNSDSSNEMTKLEVIMETREATIRSVFDMLDTKMQEKLETMSHHSSESGQESQRSHRTISSSPNLIEQEARAQAAKAKMQYKIEENRLRKQQALLEAETQRKKAELAADLDLLKAKGELAEAEAQVSALRNSDNIDTQQHVTVLGALPLPSDTQRAQDYVNSYFPQNGNQTRDHNQSVPKNKAAQFYNDLDQPTALNPSARDFVPTTNQGNRDTAVTSQPQPTSYIPISTDFTRFLLKKELLVSRLTNFSDKPENYAAWKAGFASVMQDLQVTPTEELDLLIKWLGHESSRYALSLRTSNFSNPNRGLQRIWQRLDERYGSPEVVEAALRNKLDRFPKLTNKDCKSLFELSDITSEIESIKQDSRYSGILAYFDASSGVRLILDKLPYNIYDQWTSQALSYKKRNGVPYPPFTFFADFLREVSKDRNDPSFIREFGPSKQTTVQQQRAIRVSSKKTEISQQANASPKKCPLHKVSHTLNQCKAFQAKSLKERKELIRKFGYCFNCCESDTHLARECKEKVKCRHCDSSEHPSALHPTPKTHQTSSYAASNHGGEKQQRDPDTTVETLCTQICGKGLQAKSCSKTILVNVHAENNPNNIIRTYAVIDDQSNASLGKTELFDSLHASTENILYSLSSCGGTINTSGRRLTNLVVESFDGSTSVTLPTLIECNDIPDLRDEIPTPEIAANFPHLRDISRLIPRLERKTGILLLIGRDLLEAHHVVEQITGPKHLPFAQKLPLGWVLIGKACLDGAHSPEKLNVNKTSVLMNGRPSILEPCPNTFKLKESKITDPVSVRSPELGDTVFTTTPEDDKVGPSVEDLEFLKIMEVMSRNTEGNWVAPLPFRPIRPRLPNNRQQALKRALTLRSSLLKNHNKRDHFIKFMQRMLDKGHAEVAPPLALGEECWYLPIFGVYHPKKKDEIRVVFDSSAKFEGTSLNSVLLSGPDLINSLLGILLRFRKEQIAVTVDIEQMFYGFRVQENQRNFLRFLWHRNNDPHQPLIEYRMCVHVFGNSPSPAIATYGLRTAARLGEATYGVDTRKFVERDFYVDDGVTSFATADQAIDVLARTRQSLLINGNLKLHKIASNDVQVMNAFPSADLAKSVRDLDLDNEILPTQRSLGLSWDLNADTFTFKVCCDEKPYTRRGVLSTVNSLFDPLGFASPVTIQGKLLLRDLISNTKDWDEPLPEAREAEWTKWKCSIKFLENLNISRPYTTGSFNDLNNKTIYVFSDASEKAIAASAYLKVQTKYGPPEYSFVLGKAKVAPLSAHTIPRLELCAAVLAVELSDTVVEQLDVNPNQVRYFSDSKVVLGYVHNKSRRFNIYVTNRVGRIRRSSLPGQWSFISTNHNPADQGTRPIDPKTLPNSLWLKGPDIPLEFAKEDSQSFPLVHPDLDEAVKPITALSTMVSLVSGLGPSRFERFSTWKSLVRAIANLKHICHSFQSKTECRRWHISPECRSVDLKQKAESQIFLTVQGETYKTEMKALREKKPLHKGSSLLSLNPYLDEDGLLRVGGRLRKGSATTPEKHPIIIPGRHHVADLLIRHHHENICHQGRHLTDGAIRAAGLWITGGKRRISSIIHSCFKCRKLRGRGETQLMADLPSSRLTPAPPFSYVGVDTFGPWNIVTRKTRGGQANAKRWAILFACLTTRAIHLEVIEQMSSSSFINVLRQFISVRGNVVEFWSDRGTNFVGAVDDLKVDAVNVESQETKDFLYDKGTSWVFNPPHSSHMGGAWERLIGVTRRILDSMLSEASGKILTHEVLTTFLAEASAIVNARPIVPVSTDSEAPEILSPSTLLSSKTSQTTEPLGNWEIGDLFRVQWRRVQALADTFWKRWRVEYLNTLQQRRKWQSVQCNISQGDIVLLKEKNVRRGEWPVGIVTRPLPGDDQKVRKAEVRVTKDGVSTVYTRPISDMVVLLPV